MISIEEIKKVLVDNYVVYVKFVRIGDTYRFALNADCFAPSHSQMVQKGETAKSAGSFKLYRDRFEWENSWSATLRLGTVEDDEKNLCELFLSCTEKDWRYSLHNGDEIRIDTGDNEVPPTIIIQSIEYFGDTARIVDKDGEWHECLVSEIA
jgi:hypothetical protein